MKVIIAPNSFKESLAAPEVAEHLRIGFLRGAPEAEVVCLPVADGGDGTLDALVNACSGEVKEQTVKDPLGKDVPAQWGLIDGGETAVIEMARASGLRLIPRGQRNPLLANSYGTGQLIRAALDSGAGKVIVGIGGSGTVDGGMGMLSALGVRFLDEQGRTLQGNGADLGRVQTIDCSGLDFRTRKVKFVVAGDVTSPLVGEQGAARVFGPQKGATPEMVEVLEGNMLHYARKIKEFLGKDISYIPGAGAAGGLGAALMAFLGAEFSKGIDLVLDAYRFPEVLQGASLVITGEGRLDSQTAADKAPLGVARMAHGMGVPVIGIAGEVCSSAWVLLEHGFSALFSLVNGPITLDEAIKNTPTLLECLGEQIARTLGIGRGLTNAAAPSGAVLSG
jgi:glycerate kinase